jgi:hypothetical protein
MLSGMLGSFGIPKAPIDLALEYRLNPAAKVLTVSKLEVRLQGQGSLSLSLVLDGMTDKASPSVTATQVSARAAPQDNNPKRITPPTCLAYCSSRPLPFSDTPREGERLSSSDKAVWLAGASTRTAARPGFRARAPPRDDRSPAAAAALLRRPEPLGKHSLANFDRLLRRQPKEYRIRAGQACRSRGVYRELEAACKGFLFWRWCSAAQV